MKRIAFVIIVALAQHVGGQTTNLRSSFETLQRSDAAFKAIVFTFQLETNSLLAGSTNILKCEIANHSTNIICWGAGALMVYLTNNAGGGYPLIQPPSPRPHRMSDLSTGLPGISFIPPLEPGETKVWTVSFVASNEILPGMYQIVANQVVMQPGTMLGKYLIESRDVKVIK